MSVVILAAGQGKRMKSALPKVLQPLAGRPLLQHVIDTARQLEPAGLCVVYGHGGEQVRSAMSAEPVTWALQAQQLGTGHALMQAMPSIPDDHRVLILYGDVPLTLLATLRGLVQAAGNDALSLLTVNMHDPSGYGRILRDAAGRPTAIVEHRDATEAQRAIREINTGLMAVPARLLRRWLSELRNDNAQGEYYLTDIVAAAVREGVAVNAVLAADEVEVMGVNDKVQLSEVEAALRRRRAQELMLAGVTLADPARIDIRGEVEAGTDVFIDVNAVLVGRIRIGARAKIGPNCYIEDCEIGEDTELRANCHLVGARIGERCDIGPFARLRPSAVLRDGVHIGNFVEVKNSEIGAGSKANHLSYIGDATIGSKVNVGAGTITCNYDGFNKWPTLIEDGAF
ncbi:MAG: bifunctional UDP-N-acetylglucosamine diphosphorylase/glucosamine-1-phosphate N-acetyltransferase GlmU, partial [Proteobacteria bacterium]|nr:bifunctional UDP-N-acetylglucosamine diphosphorylase/glucosamine-1-phosphate N-acetyltransferase GlmU [Pseudomonadota bacterium]